MQTVQVKPPPKRDSKPLYRRCFCDVCGVEKWFRFQGFTEERLEVWRDEEGHERVERVWIERKEDAYEYRVGD